MLKKNITHNVAAVVAHSDRSFDSCAKALVFEYRVWQNSVVKRGDDNSTVKRATTGLSVTDIRI